MQIYHSYMDTFKAAVASQTFAICDLQHIKLPMNIDTTGCYKIFFFLSGNKRFHIDNFAYDVAPGDLYFVNQREWHYFSQVENEENHKRFVIFIYPDYIKKLCTAQTDLCTCFQRRENCRTHRLALPSKEQEKFLYFIRKASSGEAFGQDLLDMSLFLELMVFANRVYCQKSDQPAAAREPVHYQSKQIYQIVTYINQHITEDLSLELLSKQFYLSASYLCRIFKSSTGTTIHQYITAKRITLAKDLLTQGYSVTDACNLSGFKDYNGFLKSFVTAVGIPPKKYAQFTE